MNISDEDKLILNGEMFFSIRKYIRLKKTNSEIITKIDKILTGGADINACDGNDGNNTILHIATQKCEKDVVIHLIQKGARLLCNKDDMTAVDLALQTNTALGKEIAEILSKLKHPSAQGAETANKRQITLEQKYQNKSIVRTDSVKEIIYPKRAGTSGVSGQFYETKLLSLVLHRALHDNEIEDFYLAANIKDIGDFDDLCFRYKNVTCFMQTKHRENTDKARLTVASVRSTTGKLGLGIYFDSFLRVRQKFSSNSSDPMFQGKFEDINSYFILYTPLKESFERKLLGKQMCSKLHDIVYTGQEINKNSKGTDIFQFDYEDRDLDFLTRFIKHEHMKILAQTFIEFILSNNKLEVMMANDLIKIYHPALAQKVVLISKVLETPKAPKAAKSSKNPNTINSSNTSNSLNYIHLGMFRTEFFYSEDPNLVTMKDTFFKEIVYTHSSKTELSKEELKKTIKDIADNPCDMTLSTLIGCPIKFDETNDKLILDINKLPKNKYKHDEIQQIKYDLQKIQVTKAIVRDAVYLAGRIRLQNLSFRLPQSFGNIDLTTNKKNRKDVEERLDFLAEKFNLLIKHFAGRNKDKQIKIIDISNDVVGPGKILELSHLNSNGGIGGAVGNLLDFDKESELFTFNTKKELGENAKYILAKIIKLSNKDLAHFRINIMIDGFPRSSFDTYQYDKNIAAEFFGKLWFYTNQAQEETVETTIKTEINKYYNADKKQQQFLFHVHSDAIFLRFHDEVQKWWKKLKEAQYITKRTTIYEKAKKDIVDSPLLTVLNVMFIRKIKHLDIEFNKNAIDSLMLNEYMNNDKNKILNLVSAAVVLSAAKIMQNSKYKNRFSFINLDYVHILPPSDYKTMMEELRVMKDMTLVIISETSIDDGLRESLLNTLKGYVKNIDTKKEIIIITREPIRMKPTPIFEHFSYFTLKDTKIKIVDLTYESQTNFLEKYIITYQGTSLKLSTLIDEHTKELINEKILWSLLNKEKMEIGHALDTHKYNEIKNYYINRTLRHDGEEYVVNALDDIDDKIVLISSKPCMGKSILLTHLSLETKKVNPKPWIVRINMSVHDNEIENLKNNDINSIMNYLCKQALKKPDEIQKIDFTEIDNETVGVNIKDGEVVSFELQLFINCYNSGNIIFLFDGFDKIYPQNTNEGIELFTALKEANKRMWITSDCYVIAVLEHKFGSSYKLERLSTIQQQSFLQRFWTTNIKLEKLNHEQFNNITLFVNYIMRIFNHELQVCEGDDDRPAMPLLSLPLHIIYLSALEYFKHEVHNISPHFLRETIKRKWQLNSYTAVDRYLGRSAEEESLELAATPLHMYIAANYFAFQITDKFDLHLDANMIYDRSNVYLNAVTLYERFLKVNIKNICEIEDKGAIDDDQEKLRDNFFDSHKKLAIYAICKESDATKILTPTEIREVKNTIQMIESGEIKTPFIDSVVDGVPRFYHLLFAEYYSVEMLAELLERVKNQEFDNFKLDAFWDFVVNVVLVSSPPSLRNAFEYKLKYDPQLAEAASDESCRRILFKLLVKPNHRTNDNTYNTDNALDIAINEGLVNVTNLLLKGIRHNVTSDNIGKVLTVFKGSALILSAADTSRSILSENVLNCIQNVDGQSIIQFLNSNEIGHDVHDILKSKIVEPIKKFTEKMVEVSNNNENLVNLVEEFPNHLLDFVRQFSAK